MYLKFMQLAGLLGLFFFTILPVLAQQPKTDSEAISLEAEESWLTQETIPLELVEHSTTTAKHYRLGEHLYRVDLLASPKKLFPDNLMPLTQEAWLWECADGTMPAGIMRLGYRSTGSCKTGQERAVLQWNLDSLPITAVIAFPANSVGIPDSLKGATVARLWRWPISGTGSGAVNIAAHRLFFPWTADGVTWQTRTISETWLESGGGDSDYLATAEDTVAIPPSGSAGYLEVGSLANAVGAWQNNRIFSQLPGLCASPYQCWGNPNNGVLYRATNSTPDSDLDRAFANGADEATAPILSITYFDVPMIPPQNKSFLIPRAPSPDYYEITVPATNWTALAIQPLVSQARSDYNLVLLHQLGGSITTLLADTNLIKSSYRRGSKPDFVVMSPGMATKLYPVVATAEGTGAYYIKHINPSTPLALGQSLNLSVISTTLLNLYDLNLTAGIHYTIRLANISGNADVGLALFKPGFSTAFAIQDAVVVADSGTAGQSEQLSYVPLTSGSYALTVFNNDLNSSPSNFQLSLDKFESLAYLPAVLKQEPPTPTPEPEKPVPLNGDFENGTLDNWTSHNPGAPLVASVVAKPTGSCFGGNSTARLGTPTDSNNNVKIPIDQAVSLKQSFTVPKNGSQLTFNYQVFSYDIVKNSKGEIFDYFSVTINDTPKIDPMGNPAASLPGGVLKLWSSPCQAATIDISQYAGQTITLKFLVLNGVYDDRNSWAYVDDVKVVSK